MALALAVPSPAQAFEAFDGRLQLHGFFETQLRSISRNMAEQWDVTQWYLILNLELELDIAPDGVGPFDLIEGFVRVEGRYDCIYSRGCGMFRSVNAYGDRAKSLPDRLSDAKRSFAAGQVRVPHLGVEELRPPDRDPVALGETGFFRGLADSAGSDSMLGLITPPLAYDDPYPYVFENFLGYSFTQTQGRGGAANGLPANLLGPWRPHDFIQPNAVLADRVNGFDSSAGGADLVARYPGLGRLSPITRASAQNTSIYEQIGFEPDLRDSDLEIQARFLAAWDAVPAATQAAVLAQAVVEREASAGAGALPFRPIPVVNEGDPGAGNSVARGLYMPSLGLRRTLESGDLDAFPFNYSESERAFNRGWSQQQTKELKEAYLDVELFDSRLWLRLGRQTIVWGKTELFSATDQFNPSDFALASLPSLEESRIPLWSVRGVYSFYEVGPLEDVRLELAFNYDRNQPADLGACGEPYTLDLVCQLTAGALFHGMVGIGVAGVDVPPSPWETLRGWEVGGRLEWRWDRFSFALSEWWGYDDLPFVEIVSSYARNVDPATGWPRAYGRTGPCTTGAEPACLQPGPTDRRPTILDANGQLVDNPAFDAHLAGTPNNALDFHHANQQVFAVACAATIGGSQFDATQCAIAIFNSQTIQGIPPNLVTSLAQGASGVIAGSGVANVGAANLAGRDPYPVVALNQDLNDLSNAGTSCTDDSWTTNPGNPFGGGPPPTCGGKGAGLIAFLNEDLSSRLTPEQEALLGCGPFWGTNCDDSGIDLLNTEASVLFQGMVGFEGTFTGWSVDNGLPQPGTTEFVGGPVGTRFDGAGGLVTLPGARWVDHPAYDPGVDGCVRPLGGANDPCAGANVLYHPRYSPVGIPSLGIPPVPADRVQIFASELGAASYNLMQYVAGGDPDFIEESSPLFDPSDTTACTLLRPQNCDIYRTLWSAAGVQRNDVRAGGTNRFGRRTFIWHGGAGVVLRYQKRNVLGFALDFAEDRTKTSTGIEFSWLNKVQLADTDSPTGLSEVDELNLTIALDRPTFINFLNPNRTFFFNTQWFIQYTPGYRASMVRNGAWNVLATFGVFTGYVQDRLLPGLVLVYDFKSVSGAALPQIAYRFSERLSIQVGASWFMGRTQLQNLPLADIAPGSNQLGPNAYKVATPTGLSPLRARDELWFSLRYTF